MQNLLIEQRGSNGLIKKWKLRSEQGTLTFGKSKHADLRTADASIRGIQGVFEFRNGKWYYINLDLNTVHEDMGKSTELCLTKDTELRFQESVLQISFLESRSPLFSSLDHSEVAHAGPGRSAYQMFRVTSGNTLLETRIIPVSETFISVHDQAGTRFRPEKTEEWKITQLGPLEVAQRTVYLSNIEALQHMDASQMFDKDAKRSLYATAIGAMILTFLFILAPKNNSLDDALTPVPPTVYKEVRMEVPKKIKESAPKETTPSKQTQQAAVAPKNSGGGASKAASMIKNLASGRITQLIGKVSASAARSTHIVVTSGVAAGTTATGRALAAVGSLSKSGKDWSSEGKGSGITISTNGKAGGQGTAALGTLKEGKTGQGGVGLLEEEGEIVGGLDREVIAQYIRSQLGQILYCYERQLSANPDLYGKVAIRFTIGSNGGVETQRIGDTTLKNATVEGCILQRVAKWKFPAPEGGTKVLVTYPFLFKSTN